MYFKLLMINIMFNFKLKPTSAMKNANPSFHQLLYCVNFLKSIVQTRLSHMNGFKTVVLVPIPNPDYNNIITVVVSIKYKKPTWN